MSRFLDYEVRSGPNVPGGLPRLRLAVLSPIWRGPALHLEYPDGAVHTVVGWHGPGVGTAFAVQVFWTRHEPKGPAVCLAIGGDAGLRDLGPPDAAADFPRGLPFLALAESLIPAEVLEIIGPAPAPEVERVNPPLLLR
jgi:hypothetical protein